MILHIFICGEDFLVARWAYLFCPNLVLKLVLFIFLAYVGNVDSQYFKIKVPVHNNYGPVTQGYLVLQYSYCIT